MAARKLTPEDLEAITNLARGWGKIVCGRAYGPDGPGLDVDLTNMEEVAFAAMRGLAAGTLETATAQQANRLDTHQPCPGCGQPCLVQHEPRSVTARTGPFEHNDPKCHCTGCRRDFFPSASSLEVGHPRLHPEGAPEVCGNRRASQVFRSGRSPDRTQCRG